MNYDIIDNFAKIFILKAFDKYKQNDYLYLTKKFRNDIYKLSLEIGYSCKYIIHQIFKYYDILELKENKYKDIMYLNIDVYDKINNIRYEILCDIDFDNDTIFTYDNFYNILKSEHKKYLTKINCLKQKPTKNLPKININPVVPQIYSNTYLPLYKWVHSQHYNYGDFSQ